SFDTTKDVPSLTGKVIMITGASTGIGFETVKNLLRGSPAHIYFAGRNRSKHEAAIASLRELFPSTSTKLSFLECDLESLSSVQAAAKSFIMQSSAQPESESNRLDILICNAGVHGAPDGQTADGYEVRWGVNYMSHALLIKYLMPIMLQTAQRSGVEAEVRCVLVSSAGFRFTVSDGIDFKSQYLKYGQSKLATILLTRKLNEQHPSVKTVAVHPGIVGTGMNLGLGKAEVMFMKVSGWMNGYPWLTPEQGAVNQTWAAVGKKENVIGGEYFEKPGEVGKPTKWSKSEQLQKELWEWTEEEL
ncbi:NAD(P)-binding protein, partial [Rhizodiscina lignyota]